jgi:hypothetical protein
MPKFDKKTTSKKAVTAYSPFTMKGSPMQRNFFNKMGDMAKKVALGPIGGLTGLFYKDKMKK